MYLLDTNVISQLRKAKQANAAKRVVGWVQGIPSTNLFISVITILELELGVLLIERQDLRQGEILRPGLKNKVIPAFEDRILSIDTIIAQQCAKLHVPDKLPDRDSLIAATGLVHSMTVVTRI